MVDELIKRVFATRNCAHLQHWKTKSYAEHEALGGFYDEVIDLLDKFVEAYQGANGLVGDVKLSTGTGEILKCLEDDAVWIAKHREHLATDISALENIVDEITGLYLSTIYKLKFLK